MVGTGFASLVPLGGGGGGAHSNDSIGDVVFFIPILFLWMGHAKKQAGGLTDKTKPMLTKSHLLVD